MEKIDPQKWMDASAKKVKAGARARNLTGELGAVMVCGSMNIAGFVMLGEQLNQIIDLLVDGGVKQDAERIRSALEAARDRDRGGDDGHERG